MKKTKKTREQSPSVVKKFVLLGLIVLIVALVVALVVAYVIPRMQNQARYERITAIYDSLNIGEEYLLDDSSVFGEKRVYDWDKGRTYSSAMYYTRGATVDVTTAELDKAIKNAGFTFFEEPYPGSVSKQYHYKSEKGEYIRLTVSSKLRDDAFFNAHWMKQDLSVIDEIDPNAGPSNVTIKVNLDDNNE